MEEEGKDVLQAEPFGGNALFEQDLNRGEEMASTSPLVSSETGAESSDDHSEQPKNILRQDLLSSLKKMLSEVWDKFSKEEALGRDGKSTSILSSGSHDAGFAEDSCNPSGDASPVSMAGRIAAVRYGRSASIHERERPGIIPHAYLGNVGCDKVDKEEALKSDGKFTFFLSSESRDTGYTEDSYNLSGDASPEFMLGPRIAPKRYGPPASDIHEREPLARILHVEPVDIHVGRGKVDKDTGLPPSSLSGSSDAGYTEGVPQQPPKLSSLSDKTDNNSGQSAVSDDTLDTKNRTQYEVLFEEICRLGRGGHGKVYKVKSKLDQQFYAVKKIKLKPATLKKPHKLEKLLREAKCLARLKHPNIVGYHTSLFGMEPLKVTGTGAGSSSKSTSSSEQESSSTDSKHQINNHSSVLGLQSLFASSGSGNMYMYIQMQLCSHTLDDWLLEQNKRCEQSQCVFDLVDKEVNMHIFGQILRGIRCVHSERIIHRDLKPANIFLESSGANLQVLIGDFGLAKEDFSLEGESPDCPCASDQGGCIKPHTANVGTRSYASPEQLQGSDYDHKTDMYSCGLILLEMFHPFTTMSERADVFREARNGKIPQEIADKWPDQYEMIVRMTNKDSRRRPSASDLLQNPLFPCKGEDKVIMDLRAQLAEKEAEIQRLRQTTPPP